MESSIEKKKILITGGLWYIWAHTAIIFLQAGYEVVIIDNLSNTHLEVISKIEEISNKKVSFYDTDLKDYKATKKVLDENQNIQWVIHLSGKKSVWESCQDPFLYYDNNILTTINLVKAMKETKVKKNIVLASVGSVYDTKDTLPPYSEKDKIDPDNPYSNSKFISERILKDLAHQKDFNVIVLRLFNPIWAHYSGILWEQAKWIPSNLVPYIYKVAKWEIEELKIFWNDYNTKDWTWIRDYIHVLDVAEAILLSVQYINEFEEYKKTDELWDKKWLYDIFNIWSGEWYSVKEIHNLVEKITETKIPYKIAKRRPGDLDATVANSQKAKQIIWREPKRSIYQALEDWRRFIYKSNY